MEQPQEHTFRVNLKVADRTLLFWAGDVEEERYLRMAAEMINKNLLELNKKYGVTMDLQNKLIATAIDALVDAQKVNSSYVRLQNEIEQRLDELDSNFPILQ